MSRTMVQLAEIAEDFGLDQSNLRKRLIKEGYELEKLRVHTRRGQYCLHLSKKDASRVRSRLILEGYVPSSVGDLL